MKSYEHRSIGRFMDTKKYGVQNVRLTSLIAAILFLVNMTGPASAHPAPATIIVNQPSTQRTSELQLDLHLHQLYANPCSGKPWKESPGKTKLDELPKLNAIQALKKVKDSLRLTKSSFDNLNETRMVQIYKPTMHLGHQLINQNLLPKPMDSDKLVQTFLIEFYQELILYAKAFYKLSVMIPNIGFQMREKRNVIMSNLKNSLKGLRCEVYSHIIGNPTDHFPKERLEIIGSDWRHDPDYSDIQKIDVSVFATYKRFLRIWSVRSKSLLRRLKSTQQQKRQKKSSKFIKKRTVRERKLGRQHRSSLSPRTVL